MWTLENRGRSDRTRRRYPSDVTDEEWALLAPLIPPAQRGGRQRSVDPRKVTNAIVYVLGLGFQSDNLYRDLPPKIAVGGHLDPLTYEGDIDRMHRALNVHVADRDLIDRLNQLECRWSAASSNVLPDLFIRDHKEDGKKPPPSRAAFLTGGARPTEWPPLGLAALAKSPSRSEFADIG